MKPLRKIDITEDMKAAARAVFVAMAAVETIRPIVEGYQKKILEEEKYYYAQEWVDRLNLPANVPISELKDTFLMKDDDSEHFFKRCNEERIKARLHVESEEHCPLLVVEHKLTQAKHLLIDAMRPVTGVNVHQLLGAGLDKYDEYIDLSLRLLAPYVDSKL